MVTTKIKIKPHLAEYVNGKFGGENGCVRFPEKFDLYQTVWNMTERRPKQCRPDTGNIEIVLPNRREGKKPETYNYISLRSQKIIERQIELLFLTELHFYVMEEKKLNGVPYIDSIHTFMCRYDINSITEDGLKKNIYRWLNTWRKREKRGYVRRKNLEIRKNSEN